jgi:hypothetical protein
MRRGHLFYLISALSDEAKLYCARDAEAGLQIHNTFHSLRDLSIRLKKEEVENGMKVDVMLKQSSMTNAVMSGVVVQSSGMTSMGMKLTAARFIVRVCRVHGRHAPIQFPQLEGRRCCCGRDEHGSILPTCHINTVGGLGISEGNMIVVAAGRLQYTVYPNEADWEETIIPTSASPPLTENTRLIVAYSIEGNGNEDDDELEYDGDDGGSPFVHDGGGIESEDDALAAYDLFTEGEMCAMDKHAKECVMDYDDMLEVRDQEPREDATADQIFKLENLEGRIQELIK